MLAYLGFAALLFCADLSVPAAASLVASHVHRQDSAATRDFSGEHAHRGFPLSQYPPGHTAPAQFGKCAVHMGADGKEQRPPRCSAQHASKFLVNYEKALCGLAHKTDNLRGVVRDALLSGRTLVVSQIYNADPMHNGNKAIGGSSNAVTWSKYLDLSRVVAYFNDTDECCSVDVRTSVDGFAVDPPPEDTTGATMTATARRVSETNSALSLSSQQEDFPNVAVGSCTSEFPASARVASRLCVSPAGGDWLYVHQFSFPERFGFNNLLINLPFAPRVLEAAKALEGRLPPNVWFLHLRTFDRARAGDYGCIERGELVSALLERVHAGGTVYVASNSVANVGHLTRAALARGFTVLSKTSAAAAVAARAFRSPVAAAVSFPDPTDNYFDFSVEMALRDRLNKRGRAVEASNNHPAGLPSLCTRRS